MDLPAEIIGIIVAYIAGYDAIYCFGVGLSHIDSIPMHDLASLRLVNKTFCYFASKHFFRILSWGGGLWDEICYSPYAVHVRQMHLIGPDHGSERMSWEKLTIQLPDVLSCLPHLETMVVHLEVLSTSDLEAINPQRVLVQSFEKAPLLKLRNLLVFFDGLKAYKAGTLREAVTPKKQVTRLLQGLRRLSLQSPDAMVPDTWTKAQSLAADFLACLLNLPETSATQPAPEAEDGVKQDMSQGSSTLELELLALAELAVPGSVPATFATLATQSLRHFDMHRVLLVSGNWCDILLSLSHMPQLVKFRLKRCKQWEMGSDRQLICVNLVPAPGVKAEVDECDYEAPLACLPLELGLAYVAALRQVNVNRSSAGMTPLWHQGKWWTCQ
ncbi:hypothetical protein BP00DRAFT_442732 [Aspergillus indologenus CBS 114.80]|uniref:F-box domain-containing protein n=1 Tax=Aspergillus indologenus CBS 114.80 TaxID=1450541 RepID=A0A2V5IFU6_9EURO|nr:hypothetical protein BP00DRAFT_442732 [Aspergillus indologenus CBS 114.80]